MYLHIEKAYRGTTCKSTVKTKTRTQDGRESYFALIDHNAVEAKYRAITKKRSTQLQSVKYNGKSCSIEKHVSNRRQAVEDLTDCAEHITRNIPGEEQRVDYLTDSIECLDNPLQATIGLIRSNVGGMKSNFEKSASALIVVDPYRKHLNRAPKRPTAHISALDYSKGRDSTGVDLY